jgi:hypothetical protein
MSKVSAKVCNDDTIEVALLVHYLAPAKLAEVRQLKWQMLKTRRRHVDLGDFDDADINHGALRWSPLDKEDSAVVEL